MHVLTLPSPQEKYENIILNKRDDKVKGRKFERLKISKFNND